MIMETTRRILLQCSLWWFQWFFVMLRWCVSGHQPEAASSESSITTRVFLSTHVRHLCTQNIFGARMTGVIQETAFFSSTFYYVEKPLCLVRGRGCDLDPWAWNPRKYRGVDLVAWYLPTESWSIDHNSGGGVVVFGTLAAYYHIIIQEPSHRRSIALPYSTIVKSNHFLLDVLSLYDENGGGGASFSSKSLYTTVPIWGGL